MRRAENDTISVEIVRFGASTITVEVPEDSTVADVLAEANITLGSADSVSLNGEDARLDLADLMDDGDSIQIVGRKDGGR